MELYRQVEQKYNTYPFHPFPCHALCCFYLQSLHTTEMYQHYPTPMTHTTKLPNYGQKWTCCFYHELCHAILCHMVFSYFLLRSGRWYPWVLPWLIKSRIPGSPTGQAGQQPLQHGNCTLSCHVEEQMTSNTADCGVGSMLVAVAVCCKSHIAM